MKLEKLTIHQLGKLGEILPNNPLVEGLIELNKLKSNFPVFDVALRLEDQLYILSIKARKKFGQNGKLNPQYNILTGSFKRSRKFRLALEFLTHYGFNIEEAKFGFMVAPFEEGKDCTYYMGELREANPSFSIESCLANQCGNIYVPVREENLRTYRVYGVHKWSFIESILLNH